MPTTLKNLKDSIRAQVFASHEPENLVDAHNLIVLEALSIIQKMVPCENVKNASVFRFCNTFFRCGLTVVMPAPRGIIKYVYTVTTENDDWCDPVFYAQDTYPSVECHRSNCRPFENPENAGLPKLPLGFKRAEATTDGDLVRAREGKWAIRDGNLYLSPFILSTEKLVIEWDGIKTSSDWSDDDPVSDAIDFRTTVKLYLQYGNERDYGDMAKALTFHNPSPSGPRGTFDEALSDLMWQCREETRLRKDDACRRCPTWTQLQDEQPA